MKPTHDNQISQVDKIRALNDAFRTNRSCKLGSMLITTGIQTLPASHRELVFGAVETFDAFTADNDPHGEHDFGSVEVLGHKIFWKIDYYDMGMKYHSPDPADPTVTHRVLTVMLAEEY